MRMIIAAIGRMKKGPEQELVRRYADRIVKTGRPAGITALDFIEIAESRASDSDSRKQEEAATIRSRLPVNTPIFIFDERGSTPTSRRFAQMITEQTANPSGTLALIIGGPDGLAPSLREAASQVISFGALTMPHQLVRILVLEQVYRVTTILTNHPYHRD